MISQDHSTLWLRDLGIDTYQDPIAYMHRDCHVCRAEGFAAQARVEICAGGKSIITTVHVVSSSILRPNEIALSQAARERLGAPDGSAVLVKHAPPVASLSDLRRKIYGHELNGDQWRAIISDVAAGRYSDLHLAAFVASCIGPRVTPAEITSLTRAMLEVGDRLHWPRVPVVDKHCVGGLPGNRTTPIVVAIVASAGLLIPKTSSRAITSPAGTADTMEVMAPVDLDVRAMRKVVEREGGCVIWGGQARLSPADDVLIRVERPLDLDSDAQLVASVLSKKLAAGSSHVLIDMPVGPTAKVRTRDAATSLAARLIATGRELGLAVAVEFGDGSQPIGRGLGPALEARDVLAVLQNALDAPIDLRDRAITLAGRLLEIGGADTAGHGASHAFDLLTSGRAWRKFVAICEAQGGLRTPPESVVQHVVTASASGTVADIDNRRLARLAKLAGAPGQPAAGLDLHVRIGTPVTAGEPIYTIHANAAGELDYALRFRASADDPVRIAVGGTP